MKTSESGQEFIHKWEGFRAEAYLDTGGVWTIGYGTTRINGEPVRKGMTCTREQAARWFKNDLEWAEEAVNKNVKVPLSQNQFDALVSFIYNVGASAFRNSTLLRELNESDYIEAANQLLRWKYDNGRMIEGLLNRRKAEKKLFETVDTPKTQLSGKKRVLHGEDNQISLMFTWNEEREVWVLETTEEELNSFEERYKIISR